MNIHMLNVEIIANVMCKNMLYTLLILFSLIIFYLPHLCVSGTNIFMIIKFQVRICFLFVTEQLFQFKSCVVFSTGFAISEYERVCLCLPVNFGDN